MPAQCHGIRGATGKKYKGGLGEKDAQAQVYAFTPHARHALLVGMILYVRSERLLLLQNHRLRIQNTCSACTYLRSFFMTYLLFLISFLHRNNLPLSLWKISPREYAPFINVFNVWRIQGDVY